MHGRLGAHVEQPRPCRCLTTYASSSGNGLPRTRTLKKVVTCHALHKKVCLVLYAHSVKSCYIAQIHAIVIKNRKNFADIACI